MEHGERGCLLTLTCDALRVKLGLPEQASVVRVTHAAGERNVLYVELSGIGPVTPDGSRLQVTSGRVALQTEGELQWVLE